MIKVTAAIRQCMIVLSLLLMSVHSYASMSSAKNAYEERDYKTAFKEFMSYAAIGNPMAQYYIGMQYYQGKGVQTDVYEANAWFSLARKGGFKEATEMMQRLRRELPSKRRAKDVANKLDSLYGDAALGDTLFPALAVANVLDEVLEPVYQVKAKNVNNQSGWALVSIDIDENGEVKNSEIFNAFPKRVFDREALTAVNQWRFKGHYMGDNMVQLSNYLVRFVFKSSNSVNHQNHLLNAAKYNDTLSFKARSGQIDAQYTLAKLYAHNLLKAKPSDKIKTASAWLLEAAKSGHAGARFDLANRLIQGRGVMKDVNKAFQWLAMAAKDGHPAAQFNYANELLNNAPDISVFSEAVKMLEGATKKGDANAEQLLGLVYATTPYQKYQFPFKSGLIGKSGLQGDSLHPDYLVILGAAMYAQDSLEKATELMSKAYVVALRRSWPTTTILNVANKLNIKIDTDVSVSDVDEPVANDEQLPVAVAARFINPNYRSIKAADKTTKLVPIDRIGPVYPNSAQIDGVEGWVRLEYSVNQQGQVQDIEVVKAEPSEIFNQAAIDALRQWRYEPIVENGSTVTRTGFKVKLAFLLDN